MHDIIIIFFFHFLLASLISPAGLLLASVKSKKYLPWEKYRNYPLTTTLGNRFASCEIIVFRSQTSSPPPLPPDSALLKSALSYFQNIIDCTQPIRVSRDRAGLLKAFVPIVS